MSPPPGHEPFLRAICQAPDDDAPRLVFADWLDENGDPDRAEFIRLQVQLARHPDAAGMAVRCEQLFLVKSRRWIADLPAPTAMWAELVGSGLPIARRARLLLEGSDAGNTWLECEPALADWERGFPAAAYVHGSGDLFLAHVDRISEFVPVRRLHLLYLDRPAELIRTLADLPFLQKLRKLILPVPLPDDTAVALAFSPHATGLRQVSLLADQMTDRAGRAFADSPYLANLEMLHFLHAEFSESVQSRLRTRFGFRVHC